MDKKPGTSARGKRKRESSTSSNSSGSEADSSFIQRAEAAAIPLLEMLKDCQLQLLSNKNTGGTIDCFATYTFSKDIKDIKTEQMNDYHGRLKVVRVGMDGAEIHPLPEWMDNRIKFHVYFGKKVATNQAHSSGDSRKRGFEVPWRANFVLGNLPNGCVVESLQLTFISPTGRGSPTIAINPDHGANLYYINDRMRNITGQTYSECCQELGIFRQATVYVKMRVPFRLLMREQCGQLRKGIPVTLPDYSVDSFKGRDNVTLKTGTFSVQVFRQVLCEMSAKTEKIFKERSSGKVTVYETNYGKDAVSDVVYAGTSDFGDFPLDPLEAQTSLLYDMLCLSLDWNVQPLKWVMLFALLERLCTPGFDVGTIPLAMERIWKSVMRDHVVEDTGKFLLAGLVIVLQSMRSDEIERTLNQVVSRDSWLWYRIQNIVEPVVAKVEEENVQVSENAQPRALSPLREYVDIRVMLMDGSESHYRVKRSCSIGKLKASIHKRLGLPSEGFRLTYKGKRLPDHDNKTVADYGMKDGDLLHLWTHMVGC